MPRLELSNMQAQAKEAAAAASRRIFGTAMPQQAGGRKWLKAMNKGPAMMRYVAPLLDEYKFRGVQDPKAFFEYEYKQYLKQTADPKYEKVLKNRDGFRPEVHGLYKAREMSQSLEPISNSGLAPEEQDAFDKKSQAAEYALAVSMAEAAIERLENAAATSDGGEAKRIQTLLEEQKLLLAEVSASLQAAQATAGAAADDDSEDVAAIMKQMQADAIKLDPTASEGVLLVDYQQFPDYALHAIAAEHAGRFAAADSNSADGSSAAGSPEGTADQAPTRSADAPVVSVDAASAALNAVFKTAVPAPLHALSLSAAGGLPTLAPASVEDAAAVASDALEPALVAAVDAVMAAEPTPAGRAMAWLRAQNAFASASNDPAGMAEHAPAVYSNSMLQVFTAWAAAARPSACPEGVTPLDLDAYVPGVHSDIGTLTLPLSVLGSSEDAMPALVSALLSAATPTAGADEEELGAGAESVHASDAALEEAHVAASLVEGAVDPWDGPAALMAAVQAGGVSALPPSLRATLRTRAVDHLTAAVAALREDHFAGSKVSFGQEDLSKDAAQERLGHFVDWLGAWHATLQREQKSAQIGAVLATQAWVQGQMAAVQQWEEVHDAADSAAADALAAGGVPPTVDEVAASKGLARPLLSSADAVREAGMLRLRSLWRALHYPTVANALDAYAVHVLCEVQNPALGEAELSQPENSILMN